MREQAGRDHLAALRPRLTSIRIGVNGAAPGIQVLRDGAPIGDAQWGTALPVDPGQHTVEASAPGKASWKTTGNAAGEGVVVDVTVPPLVDAGAATGVPAPAGGTTTGAATGAETYTGATPVLPPPAATNSGTATGATDGGGSPRKTIGWIVGGVGAASLVAGTVFGVLAATDWSSAKDFCPNAVCPNPSDVSRGSTVNTEAILSDVFIGVGIAGVAAGAILILTAPKSPPPRAATTAVQVVPLFGGGNLGLSARTAF
jgi:hypothetical protein